MKYKILLTYYKLFKFKIIYYMLEKFKVNFQSYIGLIYGRDHLLLLCEPLKKNAL
jgi:hypothetical protein